MPEAFLPGRQKKLHLSRKNAKKRVFSRLFLGRPVPKSGRILARIWPKFGEFPEFGEFLPGRGVPPPAGPNRARVPGSASKSEPEARFFAPRGPAGPRRAPRGGAPPLRGGPPPVGSGSAGSHRSLTDRVIWLRTVGAEPQPLQVPFGRPAPGPWGRSNHSCPFHQAPCACRSNPVSEAGNCGEEPHSRLRNKTKSNQTNISKSPILKCLFGPPAAGPLPRR